MQATINQQLTDTSTSSSTTSTTSILLSPYQDFQMNPWWDVVQNDTHEITMTSTPSPIPNSTTNTTTATITTTTENTTNKNTLSLLSDSTGVPAPPIPSTEPEVSLQQATHQICEEAARLLNQIFQLYTDSLHIVDNNQISNTGKQPNRIDPFRHTNDDNDENHHHDDDNTNTIDPSSSFDFDFRRNVPIPYITSYDISIHIGSCEQNSMGIRQRNPLCRSIFDIDVRQRRHNEIIQLLYENGYLHSIVSCPEDEDDDTDLQKSNDEDTDMNHEDDNSNIRSNHNVQKKWKMLP